MTLSNSHRRCTRVARVVATVATMATAALIALGAIASPAAAQIRREVPLRPIVPKPAYTQMQITSYAASLEASLDNSSFAKQVVGPAAPVFETSPPNATGTANVTLRWSALPSTGAPRIDFQNLMGYVVLRATNRPGVWDSVAFVHGPPAHVEVQLSPQSNAIFRVGAYYNLQQPLVVDNGTNASGTHMQMGQARNWIADTTRAVRVITH